MSTNAHILHFAFNRATVNSNFLKNYQKQKIFQQQKIFHQHDAGYDYFHGETADERGQGVAADTKSPKGRRYD